MGHDEKGMAVKKDMRMQDIFSDNEIQAYAGYFLGEDKLKQSSSGGAATAVSEAVIRKGGVVFGVRYSSDFLDAEYGRADSILDLHSFKGSKYISVKKRIMWDGKYVSVFSAVEEDLISEKIVLFIGSGCCLFALQKYLKQKKVSFAKLYMIEHICDGVTDDLVHREFVSCLKNRFHSKVTQFNVRYKKNGWVPPYIFAKFENGELYERQFSLSDYGYAFSNYKLKKCYHCSFKGAYHPGDLVVGDYWGCCQGMEEYNPNGVSLMIVQSEKGKDLLDFIDTDDFSIKKTDARYALYHNKKYFISHEPFGKWALFDDTIKKSGLRNAVCCCEARDWDGKRRHVIMWGAGQCFYRYCSVVQELCHVSQVVDSDKGKWGKEPACGITCISPNDLERQKDVFVIIMLDNVQTAFRITAELVRMGIFHFDIVHNWIRYADEKMFY